MSQQSIPVYCLNLARSARRRALMEAEFRRVGWEATFVPALDGARALDLDSMARDGVLSSDNQSLSNPLSHAEVGCYLTHEHVWKLIRRNRQPYAIICEDDIEVQEPAIDLAQLARQIPKSCDLFYLYYMNDRPGLTAPAFDTAVDSPVARLASYSIYSAWSCGGTQCYLITAPGAEKALANSRPIRHPIDGFLARMSFQGLMKTFATHPRAVRDRRLVSTIG